jgi:hypothetical protein
MSEQLEIVKFRDELAVTRISRFVPGMPQPTLEIIGEDFSTAEEVRVNEITVQEFAIINKTTIWAQLPSDIAKVSSIEVVSSGFTRTTAGSKVTFLLGQRPKKVAGILKLTQLFMKWLLQSPGSDILSPARGGGLQGIVGSLQTSKDMSPVFATVVRAVDTTVTQIREAQSLRSDLPLDERLLSAEVKDIDVVEGQMFATVRVEINSIAGRAAVAALEL